jgi:hypothetical protein
VIGSSFTVIATPFITEAKEIVVLSSSDKKSLFIIIPFSIKADILPNKW